MSFFSRGSKGSRRGRGRRPNVVWQEGRNKRIRFSVHFDANSKEFNQLVQNGHLSLGGQQALPQTFASANTPLQPHLSIVDVTKLPQPMQENDGWEEHQVRHASGIINWPNTPNNPPFLVTTLVVSSVNSFVQSPLVIKIKSSPPKLSPDDKKGKKT